MKIDKILYIICIFLVIVTVGEIGYLIFLKGLLALNLDTQKIRPTLRPEERAVDQAVISTLARIRGDPTGRNKLLLLYEFNGAVEALEIDYLHGSIIFPLALKLGVSEMDWYYADKQKTDTMKVFVSENGRTKQGSLDDIKLKDTLRITEYYSMDKPLSTHEGLEKIEVFILR